ncbi:Structural maintenance of chromosomes protein 3 [Savitreella phatthalungensis]
MVFIKQITIQGFKSYKDQVTISDFSPKQNVVVGRNGSGKSNFFAAIRFVLSDDYNRLDREERQALLHEGSGTAVMSAYVEIKFDNTDNRFPTGNPEVILRRTIGLKKDEYSLDRKAANKSDVANLLEAAGFSRANPYYIVPQGRITHLTNAKDSERLNLLKEVAGTQTYEQKRSESLKIMDDVNARKSKIDESLRYIEERLSELEAEKNELKEFQESDRQRRALEYTIYSREQEEINARLAEIDGARADDLNDSADKRETFINREQVIQERDAEIANIKKQLSELNLEKEQLLQERRDQNKLMAMAELQISRLSDVEDSTGERATARQQELIRVEQELQEKQGELIALQPQHDELVERENTAAIELERTEAQARQLYSKQARQQRFANRSQRDRALNEEIAEAQGAIKERNALQTQFAQDVEATRNALTQTEAEISENRAEIESARTSLAEIGHEGSEAKRERDELIDRRKELWREEARTQTAVDVAREELQKAERSLQSTTDRSTARGLEAARRLAQDKKLTGYYGPLYELFEVDDRYRTAVETAAGASLFHVVVDTDATAATLLEAIQRENAGRVTFVPLNRITPRPATYPGVTDALPLIEKLSYDSRFAKAMEQVFNRTIICPNIELASRFARSHQLNAITLSGDSSDRRGALTGGFHDIKTSRLQAGRSVVKWRKTLEQEQAKANEVRRSLLTIDQEITRSMSVLQRADHRRKQIADNAEPLQRALLQKTQVAQSLRESLARKEETVREAHAGLQHLEAKVEALMQERDSPFSRSIPEADQVRLQQLNDSLERLRKEHSEISSARLELEGRLTVLQSTVRERLMLERDRLLAQQRDSGTGIEGTREQHEEARESALSMIQRISSKLERLQRDISKADTDLQSTESSRRDLEKHNRELARAIERQHKETERAMQKKSLLTARKDECSRNIRELGILPEDAFRKYTNTASDTLVKRLHKVNETLKKFSHINKKAFDQYNQSTKERDRLLQRNEEIEQARASIADLIDTLDHRKDEAIERTFKQVSKAFAEIFQKLVPQGRGRLIIQRRHDQPQRQQDPDDPDDDMPDADAQDAAKSVENYVGVAISVSFDYQGPDTPQQRIQQLSGGQKSLCALALIFAIQRCDPAPFYLMDEVDAALDAQYRTAVAAVLRDMSTTAQFICTTFRPEMIHTADKFYGVFFRSKLSSVEPVEQDLALTFVEGTEAR